MFKSIKKAFSKAFNTSGAGALMKGIGLGADKEGTPDAARNERREMAKSRQDAEAQAKRRLAGLSPRRSLIGGAQAPGRRATLLGG